MTFSSVPMVSVVMPSLNQVSYIGQAIESVLSQHHGSIELIVMDGGSSDGTVELLTLKQKEDPRLRWFSRKDGGPVEALNNGFSKVRGTIVGWLNSDDLYEPGAISRAVVSLFDTPNRMMTYGHGQHIDQTGSFINHYPTLPPETPISQFSDGCFICQPTVFFKRSMMVLLGTLDERLKAPFDFDYWLRAFLAFPTQIGFVDKVQAYSRLHDDCITMRMRRTVAVEGMQVIATHLGSAPGHWLLTYANELLAQTPTQQGISNLRVHMNNALEEVRPYMLPSEWQQLAWQFEQDTRLSPPSAKV